MFRLRLIWAIVQAASVKRADLVVENLALSRGAGFIVRVHHPKNTRFVVGTRAIGLNQVSGKDNLTDLGRPRTRRFAPLNDLHRRGDHPGHVGDVGGEDHRVALLGQITEAVDVILGNA